MEKLQMILECAVLQRDMMNNTLMNYIIEDFLRQFPIACIGEFLCEATFIHFNQFPHAAILDLK